MPDPVTVYQVGDEWHVDVVASATGQESDTTLVLQVSDDVSVSFEDLDWVSGVEPAAPRTVMASGTGANPVGILANFTFLSLNDSECVEQWRYEEDPFR